MQVIDHGELTIEFYSSQALEKENLLCRLEMDLPPPTRDTEVSVSIGKFLLYLCITIAVSKNLNYSDHSGQSKRTQTFLERYEPRRYDSECPRSCLVPIPSSLKHLA